VTSSDRTQASAAVLADRLDVAGVLLAYGSILDDRQWDRLEGCFTPDAVAVLAGGPQLEGAAAIVAAIREALAFYTATHHHIAGTEVDLDGDRARLRANLIATHLTEGGTFEVGGVYREELVRTDDGWRISHHQLDALWMH
jgi:ketosteroid isomerase-like protein